MKLRGIEFGPIWDASGVEGFFGEGYWFHHVYRRLFGPSRFSFEGVTFVSKTATLFSREGNMKLTGRLTPRELFPSCVKAKPFRGLMLNAVGLSNPGIAPLLMERRWQERKAPFLISIMSVADTPPKRLAEYRGLIDAIAFWNTYSKDYSFQTPFGIQINLSCPNTGHDPKDLIGESVKVIEIAGALNVPIVPKYSVVSAPITAVRELAAHPLCDALCVSNTIPYNWEGFGANWWGRKTSPLERFGGGGISGRPLLSFVARWVKTARDAGIEKPINAGGGILHPRDVDLLKWAGATSVFVGTAAALRPWRLQSIVEQAYRRMS